MPRGSAGVQLPALSSTTFICRAAPSREARLGLWPGGSSPTRAPHPSLCSSVSAAAAPAFQGRGRRGPGLSLCRMLTCPLLPPRAVESWTLSSPAPSSSSWAAADQFLSLISGGAPPVALPLAVGPQLVQQQEQDGGGECLSWKDRKRNYIQMQHTEGPVDLPVVH